jgi:putative Mg2+ transporter-C (MgtC) family protein
LLYRWWMLSLSEIALRLAAATVVGAVIGLNRDLHGKPTGVRTLGIVGLGAALAVLAGSDFNDMMVNDTGGTSRVIQGVITGVGFLGAGVIIKDAMSNRIHGLTTAATIWLTACLGIVCGLGAWRAMAVALPLAILLLVFGGRLQKVFHRAFGGKEEAEEGDPESR